MHVLLKVKYVCVLTDNFFEMGCINELTISSWLNKTKEKKTIFLHGYYCLLFNSTLLIIKKKNSHNPTNNKFYTSK